MRLILRQELLSKSFEIITTRSVIIITIINIMMMMLMYPDVVHDFSLSTRKQKQ